MKISFFILFYSNFNFFKEAITIKLIIRLNIAMIVILITVMIKKVIINAFIMRSPRKESNHFDCLENNLHWLLTRNIRMRHCLTKAGLTMVTQYGLIKYITVISARWKAKLLHWHIWTTGVQLKKEILKILCFFTNLLILKWWLCRLKVGLNSFLL